MSEHFPPTPRAAYWRKQLEAWRASGQSQQVFCKRRALSYSQFQYWRRKLRSADDADETPMPRSGFVTVQHSPLALSSGLTVVLPNGAEVRGIDADNLALVERLLGLAS